MYADLVKNNATAKLVHRVGSPFLRAACRKSPMAHGRVIGIVMLL